MKKKVLLFLLSVSVATVSLSHMESWVFAEAVTEGSIGESSKEPAEGSTEEAPKDPTEGSAEELPKDPTEGSV